MTSAETALLAEEAAGPGQDLDLALPSATAEQRDVAYRALLGSLALSTEHRDLLLAKGLTLDDLVAGMYRSLEGSGYRVLAANVAGAVPGIDLTTVPGFFTRSDKGRSWLTVIEQAALVVPVLDSTGRVAGLRLRYDRPESPAHRFGWATSVDHDGPASGFPVHVPVWDGPTGVVRITDNELKAAVATRLSQVLTISVPSLSDLSSLVGTLAVLDPDEVLVAFDADADDNPSFAQAVADLVAAVSGVYKTEVEQWDQRLGSAIDELFFAGGQPERVPAERYFSDVRQSVLELGDMSISSSSLFKLTDLGNAERLVRRHGADLRYCHTWGTWLTWDTKRWVRDTDGAVVRLAAETVKSIATEADSVDDRDLAGRLKAHAHRSASGPRIREMVRLAAVQAEVVVSDQRFDTDPWLLNVRNGTVDLRTGKLRPHSRSDYLTKLADVDFDPAAKCPVWDNFLARVLQDKDDLIDFFQRTVGYSLTGQTTEQVMFLLHGPGANGKSVCLRTLSGMLGDYAQQTPPETFVGRSDGGVPNDIARLQGSRFVVTVETEAGRRLSEVLVKGIVGGDTVSARFMRGEFFDFVPVLKLWLATNHKPVIKGTDEGIWRRIKLIPFTAFIPEAERDGELLDKLRAELPGVLAWAVRGCLCWRDYGLGEAKDVVSATDAYRAEMDVLAGFVSQCCDMRSGVWCWSGELYEAYLDWCKATGEKPESQKAFGARLKERGLVNVAKGKARRISWVGITLKGALPA